MSVTTSPNINGDPGLSSGQTSALAGIQYDSVTAPTNNLSAAIGAAGVLTGAYYYSVSFVTANGETAPWPGTPTVVNPVAQQVNLTNIPIGLSGTIQRKLYRTVANPVDPKDYLFLDTINDNSTTTYTDNIADGLLGNPPSWAATNAGRISINGNSVLLFSDQSVGVGQIAGGTFPGYANVAIGYSALSSNTRGRRNTAIGEYALSANTTGYANTAVGTHALNSSTTGATLTAIGYGALFTYNGTGSNTAVGYSALYTIDGVATGNTAVGDRAGQNLTTGTQNTLLGERALQNVDTESGNTAIGYTSLQAATGGNFNTMVGAATGASVTTGGNNTAIGYRALSTITTNSGCVALGWYAGRYGNASNEFWVDNQDRTNLATQKTNSLIYGVFAAAPANQTLAVNAALKTLTSTVATLPNAATVGVGFRAFVTDATGPTFGATVVGGGAVPTPVYSDGTNWKVG